jgi:AcrR family transcriptional regulator
LTPDPPQPRRQRLSKAERRELIERAALDVFAERGYHGASIGEIARRAGVTPPVLYDHFDSKLDLHRRLLERTREELLAMWVEHLPGDVAIEERVPAAIEAWAGYVETHPYAPRMYFVETTGLPEIRAVHGQVQAEARAALAAILGAQPGAAALGDGEDSLRLEMVVEVMRAGLTGLATWWLEHPAVPRSQIVEVALGVVWTGLERMTAAGGLQAPGREDH